MKNYIFLINTMQINYRKLLYTHTKRRPNDAPFDDLKSCRVCLDTACKDTIPLRPTNIFGLTQ